MFADKNSYDEEKLYQYQKIDNDMNETMAAIERCVKANPDLKGILITSDIEALLASAILENHPVIKVPSFESIFLQKHKYYSRMNESNHIKCKCIDVFDDDWEATFTMSYPLFLKPPDLFGALHQYIINDVA